VNTPELERLGDDIAELSAHLDAATARLLDLIRDFDLRGGWGNGFRSCAAWLTWRVGLDPGAARERVRVARALGMLPLLAGALARGELSYSKVRALTRVATPETEERLLKVGRAGTAEHVARIVRGWRRVDRIAETRETIRRHRRRALHVYQDEDGMVVIRGRLEPEAGAVLMKALEAAREARGPVINKNGSAETLDPVTGLIVGEDTPTWGPAAGRRAGAARRDGAAPRSRSRDTLRTVSGGRSRGRPGPGGSRCPWPVGPRRRRARFRGNVPAPRVRRDQGRHATRAGR